MVIGLVFAVFLAASTYVYSDTAQREIADSVLRFHVLANSNDDFDQDLKETVRLAVLGELENTLTNSTSLGVTVAYVHERLDDLTNIAKQTITEGGFDYPAKAEITRMYFPTVVYGSVIFPPGYYETLTVTIGEGEGRNWWCLMFPPLCYVEMTSTEQTRSLLEENIPGPGFTLLTFQEQANPSVAVRFKIIEWWQNRRQPQQPAQNLQRAGR